MSDKVIPLARKAKDSIKDMQEANEDLEAEMMFEEIMKENQAKKDKLAKERAQANKSVLRTYRIKY